MLPRAGSSRPELALRNLQSSIPIFSPTRAAVAVLCEPHRSQPQPRALQAAPWPLPFPLRVARCLLPACAIQPEDLENQLACVASLRAHGIRPIAASPDASLYPGPLISLEFRAAVHTWAVTWLH